MNLGEIVSFLQSILPILTVILPVTSGIIGYLTAIQKVHKDLEAEFDKELRTRRMETYPLLWRYIKILSGYPSFIRIFISALDLCIKK